MKSYEGNYRVCCQYVYIVKLVDKLRPASNWTLLYMKKHFFFVVVVVVFVFYVYE